MAKMNKETKQRLQQLFQCGQFVIRWGFIPTVLYLGGESDVLALLTTLPLYTYILFHKNRIFTMDVSNVEQIRGCLNPQS